MEGIVNIKMESMPSVLWQCLFVKIKFFNLATNTV